MAWVPNTSNSSLSGDCATRNPKALPSRKSTNMANRPSVTFDACLWIRTTQQRYYTTKVLTAAPPLLAVPTGAAHRRGVPVAGAVGPVEAPVAVPGPVGVVALAVGEEARTPPPRPRSWAGCLPRHPLYGDPPIPMPREEEVEDPTTILTGSTPASRHPSSTLPRTASHPPSHNNRCCRRCHARLLRCLRHPRRRRPQGTPV